VLCENTVNLAGLRPRRTVSETRRQVQSIDWRNDIATGNPTNDPKKAQADDARIQDLPEPEDFRELTPDEEKSVVGGGANDGIGGVGVGFEGEACAVRLGSWIFALE
jgi:hypothetical protein